MGRTGRVLTPTSTIRLSTVADIGVNYRRISAVYAFGLATQAARCIVATMGFAPHTSQARTHSGQDYAVSSSAVVSMSSEGRHCRCLSEHDTLKWSSVRATQLTVVKRLHAAFAANDGFELGRRSWRRHAGKWKAILIIVADAARDRKFKRAGRTMTGRLCTTTTNQGMARRRIAKWRIWWRGLGSRQVQLDGDHDSAIFASGETLPRATDWCCRS
ncbi:hypothetical protein ANO11243_094540 [Dothideomycetidae sp. 11243]|nr:hypothetical protein ANO11243_094540 [fungal sp. No.11243]